MDILYQEALQGSLIGASLDLGYPISHVFNFAVGVGLTRCSVTLMVVPRSISEVMSL